MLRLKNRIGVRHADICVPRGSTRRASFDKLSRIAQPVNHKAFLFPWKSILQCDVTGVESGGTLAQDQRNVAIVRGCEIGNITESDVGGSNVIG